MKEWLSETVETYFSNPTARRDFRTQLRGVKPMLLWSAYLLLLIMIGMTMYSSAAGDAVSLAQAQGMLQAFYGMILALLAGAVTLVAPSLTASSVAMERQRRSLDLVLSTPLHIKSYLVGKLIASYRYTWVFLLLSLPLVSIGVILGGATWIEVAVAYFRLSIFGLLFTAIGLLASVLAPRPISAIVYAYIGVGGYLFLSSAIAYLQPYGSTGFFGWASLSPFIVGDAYMFGSMPLSVSWLFPLVVVLIACKLLLLAAGSAMSGYESAHTKSLRLHMIALAGMAGVAVAASVPDLAMGSFGVSHSGTTLPLDHVISETTSFAICIGAIITIVAVPFIACYSQFAERRSQPDGFFDPRKILLGTPAGALPFLVLLVAVASAAAYFTLSLKAIPVHVYTLFSGSLWSLALLFAAWSISRLASAMARTLTGARGLAQASVVTLALLPLPVLQAYSEIHSDPSYVESHPLVAAFMGQPQRVDAAILLCCVGVLAFACAALMSMKKREMPLEGTA